MKNLEWRWLWMLTAQSYGCFHFDPSIRQGKTQLLPLRFISEYCLPSPLYSSLHSLPSDARVVQMTTLYSFDLAQEYLSPTECVALAIKQTSTAITHNSPIGFRHGCTTTVLFLPCWHNKMCFREEDAGMCGVNGDTKAFFWVFCVLSIFMRHWWSDYECYLKS